MNARNPSKRADSTRELIRVKALERGQQRSADTRSRVETAMAAIEGEMAANDGIYPHNKGAVSAAEVARRAGVHPTTFFSPKQRELGQDVRDWLESLKKCNTVGVGAVKTSLTERVADWRAKHDKLAQSHRDTELKLQQAEAELGLVLERLGAVTHERDILREQLTKSGGSSVVPLLPRRR